MLIIIDMKNLRFVSLKISNLELKINQIKIIPDARTMQFGVVNFAPLQWMDIGEISLVLPLHKYILHPLRRILIGEESLLGSEARWTSIQMLILLPSSCGMFKKLFAFLNLWFLIYKLRIGIWYSYNCCGDEMKKSMYYVGIW